VKNLPFAVLLLTCASAGALAQGPPTPDAGGYKAPPAPKIERLGPTLIRMGAIRVDTATREVSVTGHINDVPILEWVANTQGGFKAYESAVSVDTDAIAFNAALLLIGLDQSHARVPKQHFDPVPPAGDPVEVLIEWTAGGEKKRVPIEQLLFDKRTNAPLPRAPWVYTGSRFIPGSNLYEAQLDGVLIGFVHSPAPIIENAGAGAVNAFGSVVLNKALVPPGTPVTLIVKALEPNRSR
jgi:hypothetical protein